MRTTTLLLALSLLLLPCAAICQGPPPPPAPEFPASSAETSPEPPPAPGGPPTPGGANVAPDSPEPTPWLMQRTNPYVIVGPTDSQGKLKQIKGKVTIITRPAANVGVASVEVLVDNKEAGTAVRDNMGLYGLGFDCSTLTEGEHTITSIGKNPAGAQVWTASTKVEVRNKPSTVPTTSKKTSPTKPQQDVPKPAVKDAPPVKVETPSQPVKTAPAPIDNSSMSTGTAAPPTPGTTYTSTKHGFWVRLPSDWVAKDKTAAMKPAKEGNGWVEFSNPKQTGLVINVRRARVEPDTTPEVLAKFNPYLAEWDRKTLLGTEAFSTRTDTADGIIHRLMFVKNGLTWMLNCFDANGKASDAGQRLFDSIVASFGVSAKTPVQVIVKPLSATPAKQ